MYQNSNFGIFYSFSLKLEEIDILKPLLIILVIPVLTTAALCAVGKITKKEGTVSQYGYASIASVLGSVLIPIPFSNVLINWYLLRYITGENDVTLLVLVSSLIQFFGAMTFISVLQ